jgi:hypothetical protein
MTKLDYSNPKEFRDTINPDKTICIYDKGKKLSLNDELNLLRFEISIHRQDRENKRRGIINPCQLITSLDRLYDFDYTSYLKKKIFDEFLSINEINELPKKPISRKKRHLFDKFDLNNGESTNDIYYHVNELSRKDPSFSVIKQKKFIKDYHHFNLHVKLKPPVHKFIPNGVELFIEFYKKTLTPLNNFDNDIWNIEKIFFELNKNYTENIAC